MFSAVLFLHFVLAYSASLLAKLTAQQLVELVRLDYLLSFGEYASNDLIGLIVFCTVSSSVYTYTKLHLLPDCQNLGQVILVQEVYSDRLMGKQLKSQKMLRYPEKPNPFVTEVALTVAVTKC